MSSHTHVIGAGLAGLSAAVRLAGEGREVTVYEAAGHAGGRCRSYHDSALDRLIDNGNHLVLSGNRHIFAYLNEIGSTHTLAVTAPAAFPFLDLQTATRWTVRPGPGAIPWWLFSPARRIPGTRFGEYLQVLRLARAGNDVTVAQCLDRDNTLYRRFWEPLAVSVLNTQAHEGAAWLLWPVLRQTFGRGEAACRPCLARVGLSETFVDPALALLGKKGCSVRFNHRLRSMEISKLRITGLSFGGERVGIHPGDNIILAVPPSAAAGLVPGLAVPAGNRAIVNAHFRLEKSRDDLAFLGLVGGASQWLFTRRDVASVTVSAADDLAEESADSIARTLWSEVARALDLGGEMPIYRVVKEKRATFAQTPANMSLRPQAQTGVSNLFLAGDWTDTGLPATLEGAVKSGRKAGGYVLSKLLNT